MRNPTTSLLSTFALTLLLFTATVTARLGSSAATAPSATEVDDFLSGVWDSIGLGHDFEDFSTCIKEDDNAGTQLQKAMTLMNSASASDVSRGLKNLDKVVSPLIDGLKACNMKDKYTKTINQMINKFTKAAKLALATGSSINIDGVEVYADVSAAISAYNKADYATSGDSMGTAMGKVFYGADNVTSAEEVAQINAEAGSTWTAAVIPEFDGVNLWQFKKARVNLRRNKKNQATNVDTESNRRGLANITIPTSFDSRTQWPKCIHAIRDQKQCGSCWAFGASEVLSDRFCIVTNQSINLVMSPQYLISCDTQQRACNGGYLGTAWKFIEKNGDVTDSCLPYASGNGASLACSAFTKCADGSAIKKYYAKVNSTKAFTTPAAIQAEIVANGPVEAGFDVYSDFMSYKSGIYSTTTNAKYLGGHAVKILGWGNANGTNYWIAANSWGTYWGETGFFRIKFGSCGIDKGCYAALPDSTRS